jgi:NAD(P)-dependent dehydrogenase (short-subunit alcohol dehydrogenase family)
MPGASQALPTRVVITGAAHGIGEGVAVALAAAGSAVALVDRDDDGLEAVRRAVVAAGGTATTVVADVTQRASVDAAIAAAATAMDGIDGLVCSAGGFPRTRGVEELEDEEWHAVLDVNLYGAFACARAAFPHLRAGGGSVVCVASEAGRSPAWLTGAHYVAAKAGMIGLARHLAREGGPAGIRVNAVAPGTTLTDRVRDLYAPEQVARLEALTPLGRLAEVEDQVAPILYLLSDAAAYVTGATLDVNGGRLMQ